MHIRFYITNETSNLTSFFEDFWPIIKHVLSQQEIVRWEKNGGEGLGWWRGWLRSALNEHSLEHTLLRLSSQDHLLM